jgi:hypothetical protein
MTAELAAPTAAPTTVGPGVRRHLFCSYFRSEGGCHRGESCTYAHGPPGTLSLAARAARGSGTPMTDGGKGAATVQVAFLCMSRTRTGGPLPTVSALASPIREVMDRRLCFQQLDEIIEIAAVGLGLKTRPHLRNYFHKHGDSR